MATIILKRARFSKSVHATPQTKRPRKRRASSGSPNYFITLGFGDGDEGQTREKERKK